MEKIFIAHIRGENNIPNQKDTREATVVAFWDSELERMDFGVAIKNPRDRNYNKALGVEIATGRARKRPNFRVSTRLVGDNCGENAISCVFDNGVAQVRRRLGKKWANDRGRERLLIFAEEQGGES